MSIRRPPSYSDSFLILHDFPVIPPPNPLLLHSTPRPRPTIDFEQEDIIGVGAEEMLLKPAQTSWSQVLLNYALILGVKGSIHVTLISIFETIFFFLYVSRSENQGILKTLDVYYKPFLTQCYSWSPTFRAEILDVLEFLGAVNQTAVDSAGAVAATGRSAENLQLLWKSLGYTGGCIGIGGLCIAFLYWSKRRVEWREMVGEHVFFVIILGLYEWLFFRTIIYNYNTLSTPELNQYLADGLYGCLGPA